MILLFQPILCRNFSKLFNTDKFYIKFYRFQSKFWLNESPNFFFANKGMIKSPLSFIGCSKDDMLLPDEINEIECPQVKQPTNIFDKQEITTPKFAGL